MRVAERDVDHGDVGRGGADERERVGGGPGDAEQLHVGLGSDGVGDGVADGRVVVHHHHAETGTAEGQ